MRERQGTIGGSAFRIARTIVAASLAFFPTLAAAARSEETAESIVRKLESNQVFETSMIEARLAVTTRFGVVGSAFTAFARKGGDVLVVVTEGPDRGQKVLRKGESVYLYYPEAEDVIWIKGSALKDSMMGSDFSYEDLTKDGAILGRYDATLGGTETFAGVTCWRVTLVAKTRNEAYAREELLVDAERFVTRRAILFSAAGKPIRELVADDIRSVAGKNVPFKTAMRDLLKKGSSTEMTIERCEIGIPLSEKYFNREELSW